MRNAPNSAWPAACGIARADELLRTGRTVVIAKWANPTWTPTPSTRRVNPKLPARMAAGPDNPMGKYALYLGWQYYAIHGTNDPVTDGRRTTSGCFRLLGSHIAALYNAAPIGTQVLVI